MKKRKRYIKRRNAVDAIQYSDTNFSEVENFAGRQLEAWISSDPSSWSASVPPVIDIKIPTPFGDVRARYGDYIVRESDGSFYVYKPELFEKIYEEIYI